MTPLSRGPCGRSLQVFTGAAVFPDWDSVLHSQVGADKPGGGAVSSPEPSPAPHRGAAFRLRLRGAPGARHSLPLPPGCSLTKESHSLRTAALLGWRPCPHPSRGRGHQGSERLGGSVREASGSWFRLRS